MSDLKTKSIEKLEKKMEEMSPDDLRFKILESAKNFKTSWIELGQALYTVWKDKLYKDWGYVEFDNFAAKEIGIRKETAFKLLRSYSFLEKEEPRYIKEDFNKGVEPQAIPSYESVDVLRKAKNNKNIDSKDYGKIRKYVLEDGKDAKDIKKDLTEIIKKQEELDPSEVREKKRVMMLKRFVGTLKAIRTEIKASSVLPDKMVIEIDKLIQDIDSEIVK